MNLKIAISIMFQFFTFLLYAQKNEKLETLLKDIERKQDFIDLANDYLSKDDSTKYKALLYLLENTKSFLHSEYLLTPDNAVKHRIYFADSLYFNLVKGKTYDEIKTKEVRDSIKQIGNYLQSISLGSIDEGENVSFEDFSLNSLSADKIKDHINHCSNFNKTYLNCV